RRPHIPSPPGAARDDGVDPRIACRRESCAAGTERDPEDGHSVWAEATGCEARGREDVPRLGGAEPDRRATALSAPAAIEEHDVVPGCVEEPRPREHLLTRALEAMHEYDRGLTDGGSDEPAVQVDAVAAREIDALDGQV